jgi:drug/metabolite transporter (DMT)-like permease
MDEKKAKTWGRTRKMGKTRYVIVYGVLIWGIVAGLTFPFIQWILFNQPPEPPHFVLSLIVFQITGIFVGIITWNKSERMYLQFLHENSPNTGD